MQVSKNFWFRREDLPWYRRAGLYMFVFLFLPATIFFGIVGIKVAAENPEYGDYLWLPSLLVSCSLMLFITAILRLIIRRKRSGSQR